MDSLIIAAIVVVILVSTAGILAKLFLKRPLKEIMEDLIQQIIGIIT